MNKRYWLAAVAILGVAGFWAANPLSPHFEESESVASSIRIEISLSERQLSVIEDGSVTRTWPVAVGKPSYPTPKGDFRVRRVIWNPRWVPPDSPWARKKKPAGPGDPNNPMGKVKIFFSEPDYYIHGTRQEDSLGQAESHGCVRMRNDDVVELGRLVMAAGGKPVSPGWTRRVINRIRATKEVRLSNAVPVTIKT